MARSPKDILLVTGMSGAGKSTVLDTLEDLGWEVVDNLPLVLLERLLASPLPEGADGDSRPLAIGFGAGTRGFEPERIVQRIKKLRDEHDHDVGTLFLDSDLRIKMLTPAVEKLFSVTDSDVGRPITDFTHRLKYDGVEPDARKVLKNLAPLESEVETKDGRWLMMRLRPYRTVEDRIDGVVLSFVDITERRRAVEALRQSGERYRGLCDDLFDAATKAGADPKKLKKERDRLLDEFGSAEGP